MIEATIIGYLTEQLEMNVYAEVPKDATLPLVVVVKTGGNEKNHIKHSIIAIKSYEKTLAKTSELNESVMDAMETLIECEPVCSVRLNSNYNNTNTANKRYCYQAVYDIYHY